MELRAEDDTAGLSKPAKQTDMLRPEKLSLMPLEGRLIQHVTQSGTALCGHFPDSSILVPNFPAAAILEGPLGTSFSHVPRFAAPILPVCFQHGRAVECWQEVAIRREFNRRNVRFTSPRTPWLLTFGLQSDRNGSRDLHDRNPTKDSRLSERLSR